MFRYKTTKKPFAQELNAVISLQEIFVICVVIFPEPIKRTFSAIGDGVALKMGRPRAQILLCG